MQRALVFSDLGNALAISGDLAAACSKFERALEHLGDDAPGEDPAAQRRAASACHLDLASCLLGLQRWEECLQHCAQAEALAPGSDAATRSSVLLRQGQALAGLGREQEAAAVLWEALQLTPPSDVWRGLIEQELEHVGGPGWRPPAAAAPEPEPAPAPAPTGSRRHLVRTTSALAPWVVDRHDVKLGRELGGGSFGKVHLAEWHMTEVAAKVMRNGDDFGGQDLAPELLDSIVQEAGLMASLRHPNIISLLGVCLSPPIIVMEFCGRDSLTTVLEKGLKDPAMAAQLTWPRRLRMLLGAALGMYYLHQHRPQVLHRDLKSPNILVSDDWSVKVADFNLSRLVEMHASANITSSLRNSLQDINPRWVAPEIFSGEKATTKSDVFGFGVVMWECLTWRLPWYNYIGNRGPIQIMTALLTGKRCEVPPLERLPGPNNAAFAARLPAYIELMQRCWAQDPGERPEFDAIVTRLRELSAE